jgi:hypothetical protein
MFVKYLMVKIPEIGKPCGLVNKVPNFRKEARDFYI